MMFIINGDKNETENEKYITKIQHKQIYRVEEKASIFEQSSHV